MQLLAQAADLRRRQDTARMALAVRAAVNGDAGEFSRYVSELLGR